MGYRITRLDAIVVAVGAFNPAIVTPDWLARHDLISEAERDECLGTMQALISNGIMAFDAEWFGFRLIKNQLAISSTKGATPRVKDLAWGILRLLPETPLSAMGMNFVADVQFDSAEEYHQFGDALVPKTIWGHLFPDRSVGVANLNIAINASPRTSGVAQDTTDQKRFIIQPSNLVGPNAVNIVFNDHRILDGEVPALHAADILDRHWDKALVDAETWILAITKATQVRS
jgi:hypothetical protein